MQIPDPDAVKPADWDDNPDIPDPTDKKPLNWDQPMVIPDPTRRKPSDWDDKVNGEWVQPMVKNPRYKGKWVPRLIYNPRYKGEWKPPLIPNPKYAKAVDKVPFKRIRYVGFDVWQVTGGIIFDNIFVGDNILEYRQFVENTWATQHKAEKQVGDPSRGGGLTDDPYDFDEEPEPDDTDIADEDVNLEDDDDEEPEGIAL